MQAQMIRHKTNNNNDDDDDNEYKIIEVFRNLNNQQNL